MFGESRPYKNQSVEHPDHTKTNVWRIQTLQKLSGESRPYKNTASGGVWRRLGASGGIWRHLEASGGIWRRLEASGGIWRHLEASGGLWRHLKASGGICSHLEPSGAIWRHACVHATPATPKWHKRPSYQLYDKNVLRKDKMSKTHRFFKVLNRQNRRSGIGRHGKTHRF